MWTSFTFSLSATYSATMLPTEPMLGETYCTPSGWLRISASNSLKLFDAGRRMHHEHVGRPAEIGDVGEILDRVEARILVHRRRQHVRRHAGGDQRVAVRRRARGRFGADQPAAAGAVLDEELLAERSAELLGEHPAEQVVRAAGHIGHDHAHRLVRPFGRGGAGQADNGSAGDRPRSGDASLSPGQAFSCWAAHHSPFTARLSCRAPWRCRRVGPATA